MFIRIESSSGMPITRQIMDQIRTHCAGGSLCPGDRLPSVRQLAQQLAVNQNTVLRVYERLTSEGLLERRHGDGTYVADRLPAGRLKAQRQALEQQAQRLAQQATQLGLEPAEVHLMIDECFAKLGKGAKAGGKADE
jgi:DNA-binding transcriptional regulator YhcF (GntR family)